MFPVTSVLEWEIEGEDGPLPVRPTEPNHNPLTHGASEAEAASGGPREQRCRITRIIESLGVLHAHSNNRDECVYFLE